MRIINSATSVNFPLRSVLLMTLIDLRHKVTFSNKFYFKLNIKPLRPRRKDVYPLTVRLELVEGTRAAYLMMGIIADQTIVIR